MRYVLTAEQIREAERRIIDGGVDETFLRFNAALAIADGIVERAGEVGAKTAVFCGAGGNGCDGILAAARLKRLGKEVAVYAVGKCAEANAAAFKYAKSAGVPVRDASEYDGDATVIVDAIFGIGLNRAVAGDIAALIDRLNAQQNAFKLAVDIPSGLNADTGEQMGTAFKAHVTLSFSCYKLGMLFGAGRDACGRILVEDVGIPVKSDITVCEDGDFKPYKRKASAHKGVSGRAYIIGGCGAMIGAPVLAGAAAHAAHLNGAGTVTLCLPSVHRVSLTSRAVLSMMKFLCDDKDGFIKFDRAALDEIIEKADAVDIGMGMGGAPDLKRILAYINANYDGVLVIDADALNAIGGDYEFLKDGKAKRILTPHVGEFRRLTSRDATVENAKKLATAVGGVVVLKSATTIVTDGVTTRLNVTGTPAMAKGGTGDVLGGCISALACAYSPLDAATIACYRNGLGAERAVSSYAEMMLTPYDILHLANYPEV